MDLCTAPHTRRREGRWNHKHAVWSLRVQLDLEIGQRKDMMGSPKWNILSLPSVKIQELSTFIKEQNRSWNHYDSSVYEFSLYHCSGYPLWILSNLPCFTCPGPLLRSSSLATMIGCRRNKPDLIICEMSMCWFSNPGPFFFKPCFHKVGFRSNFITLQLSLVRFPKAPGAKTQVNMRSYFDRWKDVDGGDHEREPTWWGFSVFCLFSRWFLTFFNIFPL